MFDTNGNPLDAFRLDIAMKIHRHGFTIMGIGYGACSVPMCDCLPEPEPYSYTIGCEALGHPEIVCFGCCCQHAGQVINAVMAEHRAGHPLEAVGRRSRRVGGVEVVLEPVPDEWLATDIDRIAGWLDYYAPGRSELVLPRIVQAVVAGDDGRFPWDDPDGSPDILLSTDPAGHPPRPPRRVRRAIERRRR